MLAFGDPKRTQAFLTRFGAALWHVARKCHRQRASRYRKRLGERSGAWHHSTELASDPSERCLRLYASTLWSL
jgi:putative transposase